MGVSTLKSVCGICLNLRKRNKETSPDFILGTAGGQMVIEVTYLGELFLKKYRDMISWTPADSPIRLQIPFYHQEFMVHSFLSLQQ